MKINDKYEINPFGNIFDPLFSLVTRPESAMPYQSGYESDSVSAYGKVKIKNEVKKFYAHKEVILSGGSINSPQLLMLSGIGDANQILKEKYGENVIIKKFEKSKGWLSKKLSSSNDQLDQLANILDEKSIWQKYGL